MGIRIELGWQHGGRRDVGPLCLHAHELLLRHGQLRLPCQQPQRRELPLRVPDARACPSAGLIGCCIVSGYGTVEDADCIYNSMQSPDESECKSSGGTWTTKPALTYCTCSVSAALPDWPFESVAITVSERTPGCADDERSMPDCPLPRSPSS